MKSLLNIVRRLFAFLLASWMLLISNGLLINHHYSHGKLFSSSIFLPADKCCHHVDEEDVSEGIACACSSETDPSENEEMGACFLSVEEEQHDHGCCSETSDWLQLDGEYTQASDVSLPELLAIVLYFSTFPLFTSVDNPSFSPDSPPFILLDGPPIYLQVSSFLC